MTVNCRSGDLGWERAYRSARYIPHWSEDQPPTGESLDSGWLRVHWRRIDVVERMRWQAWRRWNPTFVLPRRSGVSLLREVTSP